MSKRQGKQNKNPQVPGAQSVNPLGNSPDNEFAGEVYSQGEEAAKKKNTK
ncbi:small, acid-soluble spore protein L [Bacillus sp. FJAT-45350]|nr:small, acid-soluble spore protein L [Bacillus sp. FJAT-45350]